VVSWSCQSTTTWTAAGSVAWAWSRARSSSGCAGRAWGGRRTWAGSRRNSSPGGLAELYGLDRRGIDELLEDLWDWYVGELNAEMADYFRGLRPRYRTAILSNAAAGGRREEQARYGLDELADVLVYSYEVGIEKPDRRIYLLTCERLGVAPGEAVFLDDLEANVVAAREVGMRAVVFGSTDQAIADVEACLTGEPRGTPGAG
jgi:HAD superfamily hydrolase (TIGR01509 family)